MPSLPSSRYPDDYWQSAYEFALALPGVGRVMAPETLGLKDITSYSAHVEGLEGVSVVVLHKDYLTALSQGVQKDLVQFRALYENAVFYVLARDADHGRHFLVELLDRTLRSTPTLGFLHIPKTAGTSLVATMMRAGGGCRYFGTIEEFNAHPPPLMYAVVAGHIKYDEMQRRIPDLDAFVTVIRHPVERFLSAIGHARRPTEDVRAMTASMRLMRERSIEEFAGTEHFRIEMGMQAEYLAGRFNDRGELEVHPELVRERVLTGRLKVYTMDELGKLAAFLERHLRRPMSVSRLNTTANKLQQLPAEDVRFIRSECFWDMCRADVEMYDEWVGTIANP